MKGLKRQAKSTAVWFANRAPTRRAAMHLLRTRTLFLAYHGVAPDAEALDAWTLVRAAEFRAQMEFLKENFDCLSIDQALNRRREGCRRPGVVVTFDDGYANNLHVALPILTDLDIPATIYVVTGIVQDRKLLWPDTIWAAAKQSGVSDIDLSDIADSLGSYRFSTDRDSWHDEVLRLLEDVKRVHPGLRGATAEKIAARFMAHSTSGDMEIQVEGNVFSPLNEKEIRELASSPLISLGAHTHCHNLLDQIPLDAAKESIEKSKQILQDMTGTAIDHFAYPNGNFNGDIVRIVQEAGFRSAATWKTGYFKPEDDPFAIKRFGVGSDTSLEAFEALASGLLSIRKIWAG